MADWLKKPKCLITAGCSFSQVPNFDVTWPVHLRNFLQTENCLFLGQGAAGNGIISRKVIYHTQKMLQIYKPEEILVGIMWSGRDRQEIYSTDKNFPHYSILAGESYRNPVRVAEEYNFYLINSHWNDDTTVNIFKNYFDEVGAYVFSIEHILRTQWFLQQYKIPYFMCEYMSDCLPKKQEIITHTDINYLLALIDKSNWIPIDNMYQYAVDSGLPFARPPDPHPSTAHHDLFVREKILPYLFQKNYVVSGNSIKAGKTENNI